MIDTMKQRATDQLSSQKNKATDGLGSIAQIARQGTRQLRDQQHDTLAGYVERAADQIDRLSQQLRDKDVNELVNDAQRLARRRPALFIGSAFALGVIGARFFKSSSRDTRDDDVDRYPSPAYQAHRNDMSRTRVSSPGTSGAVVGSRTGAEYSSESNVGTMAPGSQGTSVAGSSTGTPGESTAATSGGATSGSRPRRTVSPTESRDG